MLTPTLVGGILLSMLTAIVYLVVAATVHQRSRHQAHKGPVVAFTLWWSGLAASTLLGAALQVVAATDLFDPALVKTLLHMTVPALVVALWGLFYYLGYIFVGGRRLLVPSLALYGVVYAASVYTVASRTPVGVTQRAWDVVITYEQAVPPLLSAALLVLLIVPILLAVVAYASLLFRLKAPEQRFRIGMVSIAFLVWFGGAFLAALLGLAGLEWWGFVGKLLALGSAVLVLIAFAPPQGLRQRLASSDTQPSFWQRDHEDG